LTTARQAIGVFDSGVGGLSVLQQLRLAYPNENLLYFADQAHVPYGSRSRQEVQSFSENITRFLLAQGAKIIVVACNTASAAALGHLRATFPEVPFVGMEPAVKPAALLTKTGKVGVLATPVTFASPRYSALMTRYAADVTVFEDPCLGLVGLIEEGQLASAATAELLRGVLLPMLRAGVDTIVLGCTHYPLVRPLIEEVAAAESDGRPIAVVDPAPAVARQVERVLSQLDLRSTSSDEGFVRLYSTAVNSTLGPLSSYALGEDLPVVVINWRDSALDTARIESL
jgi:glutamate racemase